MRYKFYRNANKVICLSSFAGRRVRGVAKCDISKDEFDYNTGKKLSRLRCDKKIAEKRVKRSTQLVQEAYNEIQAAIEKLEKAYAYFEDASHENDKIRKELEDFFKDI